MRSCIGKAIIVLCLAKSSPRERSFVAEYDSSGETVQDESARLSYGNTVLNDTAPASELDSEDDNLPSPWRREAMSSKLISEGVFWGRRSPSTSIYIP